VKRRFATCPAAILTLIVFGALTTVGAPGAAGRTGAAAAKPAKAASAITIGPRGLRFYTPGRKLPSGPHGTLIWERPLNGGAALGGARNYRVLYKQVGIRGELVAVSGLVAIPQGEAPQGGWPVISWAHGTTGIADQCAPSRLPRDSSYPLLASWIKAGYAVLRTDYEGLGGPGAHPYLIGRSEGYGVLDIVRAARQLDPALSERVIITGHSQGGHAALWAASLSRGYTPEVKLRGVVAFAPASHIATEAAFLKTVTAPSLTPLAAEILRGIDIGYPSLHIGSLLTPAAVRLYPQTLTTCLGGLGSTRSFGGLPLDQLVLPSANIAPAIADLTKNDPGKLKIGAPVLLAQGLADQTVLPVFTQGLSQSLSHVGDVVTLRTYAGATHGSVLKAAQADAAKFLKRRLGR
jgi:pimeloyl-ACP methyl ester carboxylesterase